MSLGLVLTDFIKLAGCAATNVVVNVPLSVLLKVLPLKKIGGLVNTVITPHRVVVILYKDVVLKREVFRNLHLPVPPQDAVGVDFLVSVRLRCARLLTY